MSCKHKVFNATVTVNRLEDIGKFNADIRIACHECGKSFIFQGLPVGFNLNGPSVSFDGQEARLAIIPEDSQEQIPKGLLQ